ncbi:hypothetical protein ACIBKX_17705 [Streptomyces sp. NPDC050658]|uniref:hypothetical protein n=1 Tax=unclassified Streptomyces TaxID=2593676 RepID=UPI003448B6B9
MTRRHPWWDPRSWWQRLRGRATRREAAKLDPALGAPPREEPASREEPVPQQEPVPREESAPPVPPPTPVPVSPVADDAGPLPVVAGLIDVLDRVAVLRGRPEGVPLDPSLLDWLEQAVLRMLADCEVRPYEGEGELDPMRHESVLSEPAPRPDLVNHVAANLRPGYLWRAEPVRPAQVTVYVAAKEGAGDD